MMSTVVPPIYSNHTSVSHTRCLLSCYNAVYKRKDLSSWIYTWLEKTLRLHCFKKLPMDYSADILSK